MAKNKSRSKKTVRINRSCPTTSLSQKCIGLQLEWKDPNPYESKLESLYDFKYFHRNPISARMVKSFFVKNSDILMYQLPLNWVVDIEAVFSNSDKDKSSNSYRHSNFGTINDLRDAMEVIAHYAITEGGDFDDFDYIRIRLLCLGLEDYKWPDEYECEYSINDEIICHEIRKYLNAIYPKAEAKQEERDRLICANG